MLQNTMWIIWIQLSIIATGMVLYIPYTVVFWFWFIYLVDAMKRKRSFYKATLRCVEGESNPHQQMLAYNAKTELVKFAFLFCLNLADWVGLTAAAILCSLQVVWDYQQDHMTDHLLSGSEKWYNKLRIPYFHNVCLIISMVLLGSLCMYLSARYAPKSWMKSNKIPYWICFFLLSSIASQILVSICYTFIIGIWCDKILVTLSVIFALKQYRKLNMVLQWSIVDLRVSGDIELLEKHVRMKRRFNRICTTIWIGVSFALVADLIGLISHTTYFILRVHNHPFTDRLLCPSQLEPNYSRIVYSIAELEVLVGSFFFFIPYVGYGVSTMCVLLWRLSKGKTGYRTHFHVDLTEPLILP